MDNTYIYSANSPCLCVNRSNGANFYWRGKSLDSLISNCNLQRTSEISFCVKEQHKCICLGSVSSPEDIQNDRNAISSINNIPCSAARVGFK